MCSHASLHAIPQAEAAGNMNPTGDHVIVINNNNNNNNRAVDDMIISFVNFCLSYLYTWTSYMEEDKLVNISLIVCKRCSVVSGGYRANNSLLLSIPVE